MFLFPFLKCKPIFYNHFKVFGTDLTNPVIKRGKEVSLFYANDFIALLAI